jgi:hypothetical protein
MASPLTYAPFVLAPPLTACDTAYLTFGQGSAPYVLNIISTGDSNGTSLEQLPVQGSAGVFKWRVDFNEGANMCVALVLLPPSIFTRFLSSILRPLRPATE